MGERVEIVENVQLPEDEFLAEDELFEPQAGPSQKVHPMPTRPPVHDVPAKKRKISKPDGLVCSLAGCPSAISGYVFANMTSLNKHKGRVSMLFSLA